MRSREHYRRGKAISITYSECVSVTFVILHKQRMRRVILLSVTCLTLLNFSTLFHIKTAGDKIEKNEMGWACGAYGWGEGVYRVLLGKPEGRSRLGRPRRRWVDNIRMDLQEVGCGYMDWIGLAQDGERWRTLVSAVMNLRVPWNAGNFLTSCKPVSCSRRTLHHGVSK